MRRNQGNMNGERYCGNINTKEVHDLDRENTNGLFELYMMN